MRTTPKMHPDLEPLKLVSAGIVCRSLNCTYQQLASWAKRGLIEKVRLPGGGSRYRLADVVEIARGRGRNAMSTPPEGRGVKARSSPGS